MVARIRRRRTAPSRRERPEKRTHQAITDLTDPTLSGMTNTEKPRGPDTRPEVAAATGKDVAVPAPHPPEFRRRAVEVARQKTNPVAELAKEFRIPLVLDVLRRHLV